MSLARRSVFAAYVALILLVFAWEAWWAPPTPLPRAFWIAVKVTPLIVPLPWLWRESAHAHVLTSLLLLIYFSEGVAAVHGAATTGNVAGMLYGTVEILLAIVAIVAASVFARLAFKSLPSRIRAKKES
ncbi:MAG TPA: DUF2069 domain-containing protein [Burkholderiales bacterium]